MAISKTTETKTPVQAAIAAFRPIEREARRLKLAAKEARTAAEAIWVRPKGGWEAANALPKPEELCVPGDPREFVKFICIREDGSTQELTVPPSVRFFDTPEQIDEHCGDDKAKAARLKRLLRDYRKAQDEVREPTPPPEAAEAYRRLDEAQRAAHAARNAVDQAGRALLRAPAADTVEAAAKQRILTTALDGALIDWWSEERLFKAALADLNRLAKASPSPKPPSGPPSSATDPSTPAQASTGNLRAIFNERLALEGRANDLANGLSDDARKAVADEFIERDRQITEAPITTLDDAAVKLQTVLLEAKDFQIRHDDERIVQVIAYLSGNPADPVIAGDDTALPRAEILMAAE